VQQLDLADDRELFDAKELDVASLPARKPRSADLSQCRGVSFAARPRNLYYHDVQPKPGATVLLTAGGKPVLTVWKCGRGTVYAMTGTPLGESVDGTAWWKWDGWQTLLGRILAQAGTPAE